MSSIWEATSSPAAPCRWFASFCGSVQASNAAYEQVYTKKIFTIPRYQQHIIDGFYTVQAYLEANPGGVHCSDFQIKQVRSIGNPATIIEVDGKGDSPIFADTKIGTVPLDRLIDDMASRNKPPKLTVRGGKCVPRFADDYDWTEQDRVRTAILAVMKTRSDALWWRLRQQVDDKRYMLTASLNETAENFSVGSFCCDLAFANLSVAYRRHLPAVPGQLPATFCPEDVFWQNEKQWAQAGKPLYEMQIEVCRRAIEQWPSVEGTVNGKDGRCHTYTADEKSRFVETVKGDREPRRLKRAVFIEKLLPGVAATSGWEGFDAGSGKDGRFRVGRAAAGAIAGPGFRATCHDDPRRRHRAGRPHSHGMARFGETGGLDHDRVAPRILARGRAEDNPIRSGTEVSRKVPPTSACRSSMNCTP